MKPSIVALMLTRRDEAEVFERTRADIFGYTIRFLVKCDPPLKSSGTEGLNLHVSINVKMLAIVGGSLPWDELQ